MAFAAMQQPLAITWVGRSISAKSSSGTCRSVVTRRSRVDVARPISGSRTERDVQTRASATPTEEYSAPLDVVALGNMCVDILHPPAPIPSPAELKTEKFLAQLNDGEIGSDVTKWEVGGNCNFLIAASRLGLRAECVGHVGNDATGEFLKSTLAEEGVPLRRLASEDLVKEASKENTFMDKTLLCHVLSDGVGGHAFCSRYDLGPWPLLSAVHGVDDDAAKSLGKAKAVFINGFVFDELKPSAVKSAVAIAKANGADVFFDPGPRAFTFVKEGDDSSERKEALDMILSNCDVILATLEEAAALVDSSDAANTGYGALGGTAVGGGSEVVVASGDEGDDGSGSNVTATITLDPATVATQLLRRPGCTADWVVIKCGPDGASVFTRRGDQVYVGSPSVTVGDTVGCGDSAAAAVVLGYAKIQAVKKKLFEASSGKIAYLPNAKLAAMMEETLTLATATGAATATTKGAGRNVATVDLVESLLDECVREEEICAGWGVNAAAAVRAKALLNDSLKKAGKR